MTNPIEFKWNRCMDFSQMNNIYESIIPAVDLLNPTILIKYPDIIKGYVAFDNDGEIIACSVIGLLKKTNVTYIDCFTISKRIRENHLLHTAWKSFVDFLNHKCIEINTNRLIMEVYLENAVIWNKVMCVEKLEIDNIVQKPKLFNETEIMGLNISIKEASSVYLEWQEIEANW